MYYQNGKYLKTITLSHKEWNQRVKNIFSRNIKKYHISRDESGIKYDLNDCIVEIELDTGNVVIACDRYKELYKTAGICKQTA